MDPSSFTFNNNLLSDIYKPYADFNSKLASGVTPMFAILCLILIVVYYSLFSLDNTANDSYENVNSHSNILEILLWSVFLVLLLFNSVQYFFEIDLTASVSKLLTKTPEVAIEMTIPEELTKELKPIPEKVPQPEVFHIQGNNYSYDDAKSVCKAYDARLATYNEVEDAYEAGGEWCSYGWSDKQNALFPTQQNTYDKLQEKKGYEHICGRPGVNGGYISNPNVRFGVNCYGNKPSISTMNAEQMENQQTIPKTPEDIEFERRVNHWREQRPRMAISPFNEQNWNKI